MKVSARSGLASAGVSRSGSARIPPGLLRPGGEQDAGAPAAAIAVASLPGSLSLSLPPGCVRRVSGQAELAEPLSARTAPCDEAAPEELLAQLEVLRGESRAFRAEAAEAREEAAKLREQEELLRAQCKLLETRLADSLMGETPTAAAQYPQPAEELQLVEVHEPVEDDAVARQPSVLDWTEVFLQRHQHSGGAGPAQELVSLEEQRPAPDAAVQLEWESGSLESRTRTVAAQAPACPVLMRRLVGVEAKGGMQPQRAHLGRNDHWRLPLRHQQLHIFAAFVALLVPLVFLALRWS